MVISGPVVQNNRAHGDHELFSLVSQGDSPVKDIYPSGHDRAVFPYQPDLVHPVSRSTKKYKKKIRSAIKKKIRPQHLTIVL
jgi:hypothetical protein